MRMKGSAGHRPGDASVPTRGGRRSLRRPTVTVGLPVRHATGHHLSCTIASVLGQDLEDLELVLGVASAASDAADACREAAGGDERVRLVTSPLEGGTSRHLATLGRAARGEYFALAVAGDRWAPRLLSARVAVLDAQPGAVLCCRTSSRPSALEPAGRSGRRRRSTGVENDDPVARFGAVLRGEAPPTALSGLIRVNVLRSSGILDLATAVGATVGDRALLAELALHGRIVGRDEADAGPLVVPGPPTEEWRLGPAYARAVDQAGRWMPATQRARAYAQLARWAAVHAPELIRELSREASRGARTQRQRRARGPVTRI
jgi:hypothetical protein